jgi:F1F0 ATPase subunit 2
MTENIYLILALIAGIIIGFIFFGGLWLTVKTGVTSKKPALLFIISFVLRTGITLLGFYFVSAGNFKKMVACLIGFTVARFIIKQKTTSGIKNIQVKKITNEIKS